MNVLEHYIVEVHEVKTYDNDPGFVVVDLTSDCYGHRSRGKHLFKADQWVQSKQQGYYVG